VRVLGPKPVLPDADVSRVEVDVLPGEPERFPLPKPEPRTAPPARKKLWILVSADVRSRKARRAPANFAAFETGFETGTVVPSGSTTSAHRATWQDALSPRQLPAPTVSSE
jgi:hypothetical protein